MSEGVGYVARMKTAKMEAGELILKRLAQAYGDEEKARELLESLRWPQGPVCPHCKNSGAKRISKLAAHTGSKSGVRSGVYFCGACRQQFTVTVGTVLERSHVPISKWLQALFLLCSSKKSLSANQIHRMIGVTYRTAWFMCHRIRFGMTPNHWAEPKLKGTVEVDETFVGGTGDRRTKARRQTPVVALIERLGLARVIVVASVTQKNLGAALAECVSKDAVVNTDEHPGYKNPLKHWKAHQTVNHSRGEYQRQNPDGSRASTNTAESFFSLLKRGVIGAWHHVSREHLAKYANEFAFRWNTRHDPDGIRLERFMGGSEGKRLTYRHVSQPLCVC
jgi:transposase-like protein